MFKLLKVKSYNTHCQLYLKKCKVNKKKPGEESVGEFQGIRLGQYSVKLFMNKAMIR